MAGCGMLLPWMVCGFQCSGGHFYFLSLQGRVAEG